MDMEVMEVLAALIAAFGTLALGWMLFSRLVTPVKTVGPVWAVMRATGDGGGLEQDVNGLLWVAAGELPGIRVVIVDAGLTSLGRKQAELLASRPEVELCRPEELPELLKL